MPDRADLSASGLDPETLGAELGMRCVVHPTVDSTMDAAASDPDARPVLHLADRQRAGRGRRGRVWASPPGNLYATVAWPDPDDAIPAGVLGAVQVAWAEAVREAGGPRCRVKWPNDGLLEGGKWAGLLAERGAGPGGSEVRIGMGANLTSAPEIAPPARWPAIALLERWPDGPEAGRVARRLLGAAVAVLEEGRGGVELRLGRWHEHDALRPGERIVVDGPEGSREARYVGVDVRGRLRIERHGSIRAIVVGEVDRLRRP